MFKSIVHDFLEVETRLLLLLLQLLAAAKIGV